MGALMVDGLLVALGAAVVSAGVMLGWAASRRGRQAIADTRAALLHLSERRAGIVGVLRAAMEVDPSQPAIVNDLQTHRIVFANRAFHAALGAAAGSLNGDNYLQFVHPEDLAETDAAADDVPLMDPSARFVNRWRWMGEGVDGCDGWVRLEWRQGGYADASGYGLSLATPLDGCGRDEQ